MKCICHNLSFKEIENKIKELNLRNLSEVLEKIDCGKQCKLCHSYIKKLCPN